MMQRVLEPAYPDLDAVLRLVPEPCSLREGWERMLDAGMLAAHWPRDPQRCFAALCPCCFGEGALEGFDYSGPTSSTGIWPCSACTGGIEAVEPSLETAGSLAADAAGLERALECVRQALERRAPWYPTTPIPTEIRLHPVRARPGMWMSQTLDARPPAGAVLAAMREALGDAGERECARVLDTALASVSEPNEAHRAAALDAAGEQLWSSCAQRGIEPFAGRESPFAPLLQLWASGYALEGTSRGIAVLLVRERVPSWLRDHWARVRETR